MKNNNVLWDQTRLGNISTIIMGQSPSSAVYNEIGLGVPLIQGNNDIKNRKSINRIWTTEITKQADRGDLILTVRAPVGKIGLAQNTVCIGRGVCTIKPKLGLDKAFLYSFLEYFEPRWKSLEQGSTFSAVNSADISKLPILLPPLPEQKRIAAILETWDNAIELLTKKIELKQQLKKGLMQQLLTGKKRLPGFGGEWKKVELGTILNYEQPNEYIVKSTDYSDNFNVPVLTAGKSFILGYTNEMSGICNNLPVIIFDDFTTSSKYVDFPFKVKSSAMKLLRSDKANIKYLFDRIQLINLPITEHKRKYISEFQYIALPIPDRDEQNAIEKILTTLDKSLKLLSLQKKLVNDQKKYLLNNLVTGKILTPKNLKIKH